MNFVSRKTLVKKILASKEFRDAFVFENIKRAIPFQIRTMRSEREWSQAQAGEALGKPQNVISRLESPAYGKLTLQTLLEIAKGFDVGLMIKFVPFSRLVQEYDDVAYEALRARSVDKKEEVAALVQWAEQDEWEEFTEAQELPDNLQKVLSVDSTTTGKLLQFQVRSAEVASTPDAPESTNAKRIPA